MQRSDDLKVRKSKSLDKLIRSKSAKQSKKSSSKQFILNTEVKRPKRKKRSTSAKSKHSRNEDLKSTLKSVDGHKKR